MTLWRVLLLVFVIAVLLAAQGAFIFRGLPPTPSPSAKKRIQAAPDPEGALRRGARAVTADDVKWINQCVKDNKGGAAENVVLKYCTCMSNKMNDNETQSITLWEKAHVAERKACDAEAGCK